MRIDLEIPVSNLDLVFIREGKKIPVGVAPLYFFYFKHRDYFPKDFISMEGSFFSNNSEKLIYDQVESGGSFPITGKHFTLTHIHKYSSKRNAVIPLFYKFDILEKVNYGSLRVFTIDEEEIPSDDYIVDSQTSNDPRFNKTTIYINKYKKLLQVKYMVGEVQKTRFISYIPIFKHIDWDDIIYDQADIPTFKYRITDFSCETGWAGKLYIKYDHSYDLLRKPIANMEDPWNIGIRNIATQYFDTDSGTWTTYTVPEYYVQGMNSFGGIKKTFDKKCEIIKGNIFKLQHTPHSDYLTQVEVLVKDIYTNNVISAYTSSKRKLNTASKDGIIYEQIVDINNEGFFSLPRTIEDNEIVLSTFFYQEDYYEFKMLDFNSQNIMGNELIGFYIKPNVSDFETSIYYCRIGANIETTDNTGKTWIQGKKFETTQDYNEFILSNRCFHVGFVKLSIGRQNKLINTIDIRSNGGYLFDEKTASILDKNYFLSKLFNEELSIPTNDFLVAFINTSNLEKRDIVTHFKKRQVYDLRFETFLDQHYNIIRKNLNISTDFMINIFNYYEEL